MDAPCLSLPGDMPPASRWQVPTAPCPPRLPSFCARFLPNHPGDPAASKGHGIPIHSPQGYHGAPLLGPRLRHQRCCPDVHQYFLLRLFCLAACQPPHEGERCGGVSRNGDLGDSFYLSCLGYGMLKSTGAMRWAFSVPRTLSASWGAVRRGGAFVGAASPWEGSGARYWGGQVGAAGEAKP